jgi:hypothetical protein
MSGIIFGNMLSGLGTGISGFAGQMSRDRAAEEEFRQRMELQQERERMLQERTTAAAAARPAAGSGDAPMDLTPGSTQEAMVAANMGKTIPELRQLLGAMRTGDWSPYAQTTDTFTRTGVDGQDVSGEMSDAVSRGTAKLEKTGEKTEFSANWESEKREMLAKLGRELGGLTYRKDYKSVAEGKATETDTANQQGIIAGQLDPAKVNDASISSKGGERFKANESGTVNVSTGAQALNELGNAKAADELSSAGRNSAAAARDRAEIEKIRADISDGGAAKPQAQERLNSIINSQNATIKSLQDGSKGKTEEERAAWQSRMDLAVQLRDEAQRLLQQSLRERSQGQGASAPAPNATKSGDNMGNVKSGSGRPPSIASIEGAPPGSSIGSFVSGKGWEVKDRSGKVIGYSR